MCDNFSRRWAGCGRGHRFTARPELGCLPAPALLALLSAEMHYHWGSSQTIPTKGACLIGCKPPCTSTSSAATSPPPLLAEIKQLKAQSRKADDREEK